MYGFMTRHDVQVLRKAGHDQKEVSEITGVSVRTVRRIEGEKPSVFADDATARRKRRIGRPSKVEAYRGFVEELLEKEPDLKSLEVLRRARLGEDGYRGGKSQFYAMVAEIRPRHVRPLIRFEGLPGEFSQHDFGEVDVRYVDGSVERVRFFASRLKWSRWVEVSLVPNQQVESLVRPLVDHFNAIGGVPLLAVFDRPKTVALKWKKDGTVTEWNATFSQVMAELGVGAEVCWPYRGQEKGSVENLVGWVKGSFFKQRRFVDKEDLVEQLAEWRTSVNTEIPCRATGVPPAERMQAEQARLRPLKVKPDELWLRFPVQVGPTGYVRHDTREYSMSPDAIGLPATLFLGRDRVRIVAGRWESVHDRGEPHTRSTHQEHRAQMLAKVSGKRGKRYLKRQQIFELGEAAVDYLTEVVSRRPRSWYDDVDRLHELLEHHGDEMVLWAMDHALRCSTYGAEYVSHYIDELILATGTTRPSNDNPLAQPSSAPSAESELDEETSRW